MAGRQSSRATAAALGVAVALVVPAIAAVAADEFDALEVAAGAQDARGGNALRRLCRARKGLDRWIELFNTLVAQHPASRAAHLHIYQLTGYRRADSAIAALNRSIQLSEAPATQCREYMALAHISLRDAHVEADMPEQAAEVWLRGRTGVLSADAAASYLLIRHFETDLPIAGVCCRGDVKRRALTFLSIAIVRSGNGDEADSSNVIALSGRAQQQVNTHGRQKKIQRGSSRARGGQLPCTDTGFGSVALWSERWAERGLAARRIHQ